MWRKIAKAARWVFKRKDAVSESADFVAKTLAALKDRKLTWQEIAMLEKELAEARKAWGK